MSFTERAALGALLVCLGCGPSRCGAPAPTAEPAASAPEAAPAAAAPPAPSAARADAFRGRRGDP